MHIIDIIVFLLFTGGVVAFASFKLLFAIVSSFCCLLSYQLILLGINKSLTSTFRMSAI